MHWESSRIYTDTDIFFLICLFRNSLGNMVHRLILLFYVWEKHASCFQFSDLHFHSGDTLEKKHCSPGKKSSSNKLETLFIGCHRRYLFGARTSSRVISTGPFCITKRKRALLTVSGNTEDRSRLWLWISCRPCTPGSTDTRWLGQVIWLLSFCSFSPWF